MPQATVNLTEAYDAATRRARRVLGADAAIVVERTFPVGLHVLSRDAARGVDTGSLLSPALVDVVAQTGKTLTPIGPHSLVIAPVTVDGRFAAAFQVVRLHTDGFSEAEARAITALARELGILAGRAPAAAAQHVRQDTLMDLLGLSGSSDPDADSAAAVAEVHAPIVVISRSLSAGAPDLANDTLTRAIERVGGHVAAIVRAGDPPRILGVAATRDAPDLPPDALISKTIIASVLTTGQPALTLHAATDEIGSTAESVIGLGVSTVVCVPLHGGAEVVGALYVATFGGRARIEPSTIDALMEDARKLGRVIGSLPR